MLFPFLKPDLPKPEEWVDFLEVSYNSRYFSNFGPLASRFETACSEAYLVPGYGSLLCCSNTLGLQAALSAMLDPGSKVALPDFTFAATLQATLAAGMVPVICDVDPVTWELCVDSLDEALKAHPDLKAVIHVRPFGLLRDIDPTRAFCVENGLQLFVDAAAGLSAPDGPGLFGSDAGEIEVFSLHATKVFGIGEGGLIAAPQDKIAQLKSAMNFGFSPDRSFGDGTNAKVDEFRAAIGLATLPKMAALTARRAEHALLYDKVLEAFPNLSIAANPGPCPWSTYPVLLDRPATQDVVGLFGDRGIEIKKYYWPSLSAGYKGKRFVHKMDTPQTSKIADRMICLPIYNMLEDGMSSILTSRLVSCLEEIGA